MVAKLRNGAKTTEQPPSQHGRKPPSRLKNRCEPDRANDHRQAEAARYIAAMSGELAAMANGVSLGLVAHFIAMAQAEAQDVAERSA